MTDPMSKLYREWTSYTKQDFIRLGTAIKYARDAISLPLDEFSRATGLSQTELGQVESGNISQFTFVYAKEVGPAELIPAIAEIEMILDWPEGRFMAILRDEFDLLLAAPGPKQGHPNVNGPWEMLTGPVNEKDAAADQEALRKEKVLSLVSGYLQSSAFLKQIITAFDVEGPMSLSAQNALDTAFCAAIRSIPLG